MRQFKSPCQFQKAMDRVRRQGETIGFVPTMGALHEGHLSLVRAAKSENDRVAVSIFVNPTQFGPAEDFRRYPKPFAQDRKLLRKLGVDYLFAPSARAMYPEGFSLSVEVGTSGRYAHLTRVLCGKFRPGHFAGVATVVSKLFILAKPHRVYFGAKDYQQSLVIKRLIEDMNFDIRLRVMPLVRERDGVAMSSRNRYLSQEERIRARGLSRTLFWMRGQLHAGERDLSGLKRAARQKLKRCVNRIDYLEVLDPENLVSLDRPQQKVLIAAACFIGKTRLIDNVIIKTPYPKSKAEA